MRKIFFPTILFILFIVIFELFACFKTVQSSLIVSTPINSVIEIPSNEPFNLTFKMRFNEPEEGFFSVTFFWDNNESDPDCVYWNFTFISFTAKFIEGSEFSNALNLSIKKAVPSGFPNNYYRYTVSISEVYGESTNGDFFLDVTILAVGVVNGVYHSHAEGVQNITIVNVRCYENLISESGMGNCSVLVLRTSGFHDISVESVDCLKSVVGQGMCLIANVALYNGGNFVETFDVKLYANATLIDLSSVNLAVGEFKTLNFSWNTSGFVKGNYTLWAYAEPVENETDIADNAFVDGLVSVSIVADVNADGKVDLKDVFAVALAYGSFPGHPKWNPNLDMNNDNKIDLKDYWTAALNYGKVDP